VLRRRSDHRTPLRAGADGRNLAHRIDVYVIDALRGDRETVTDRVIRAVSRALHGDRHPLLARESNRFDDIRLVGHADDHVGRVLDREVEGGELGSEARVDRNQDRAPNAIGECSHRGDPSNPTIASERFSG
jgi:hypothetical protein